MVQPEILDSLPEDDPEAIGSRRDLRLINALMGNFRWIGRTLRGQLAGHDSADAIELGSGEGSLGARLARRPPHGAFRLAGLDLAPRPETWPEHWDWCAGDLFDSLPTRGEEIVVANLVLHHFSDDELRRLGGMLQNRAVLLFSEPSRARWHHLQGYALYPLGVNRVTRHDLHVSIRAGFRTGELPALLGLGPDRWEVREQHHLLGAQRMLAVRR